MAADSLTLTLSAADVSSFPVGKGVCHTAGKVSLIVFKSADGLLKVAPNTCAHLSQKLAREARAHAALPPQNRTALTAFSPPPAQPTWRTRA